MRFLVVLMLFLPFCTNLRGETQNDSCHTSLPFCGSDQYTFPAGVNTGNAQSGPYYDCLNTQPNPAWYYMQVGDPGDIIIFMFSTPLRDIDFCCWGPFSSPAGACSGGLTADKIVDCSYSGNPTETCTINDAQSGEFYILLITNFSNQTCNITFSQTNYGQPGAGTTNCDIVIECSVVSLSANPTSCSSSSNTFNLPGTVEFSNQPPTGTLVITDLTANPQISQTFNAPFTSPTPFMLLNIPCDGLQHHLQAAFSDSTNCTLIKTYNAPNPICPTATIYGGGTICYDPGITVSVNIALTGASPWDFTYAIDGVSQTPVTNYSGASPYIINTNTSGTYTLISVSNAACSGSVSGSATVIVNQLPTVTLNPFPPTCENTLPFALSGGSPAGGIYSGSGVSSGMFDPAIAGAGNKPIVYTYTDANSCTNSDTSTLLVNANPTLVISPNSITHCSGDTLKIFLESNLPDSTFFWTAVASSSDISGYSDGNGDTIVHILTNSGYLEETVQYTITSHAANCSSDPQIITITVFPVPDLKTTPLFQEVCSGQATNITLASNVPGTSFTWTCSQISGHITGYMNNPGPGVSQINQTLLLAGYVEDSVVYHLTPQANGCAGNIWTYTVTVFPIPDVFFVPNGETVCDKQCSALSIQSHVAGTSFLWTATPSSGNLSGYSNGSGDLIAQTISNAGATIETVTYQVTPTANGCPPGTTMPVILTVNPRPAVTNPTTSSSQCNNATTAISLLADVTGSTFAWRAFGSSADVSGYSNGSGATIAQPLINSGFFPQTVTYRVAATANSCTGDSTNFVVTVFPVADVIFTPPGLTLCSGQVTDLSLHSDVANTTFTWTATGSSIAVTGYTKC